MEGLVSSLMLRDVGRYAYIELRESASESRRRGRELSLRSSTLSGSDDGDDGKNEEGKDDDLKEPEKRPKKSEKESTERSEEKCTELTKTKNPILQEDRGFARSPFTMGKYMKVSMKDRKEVRLEG